jgi:hypothetical protein
MINEQGQQRIIITTFNCFYGKYTDVAWIIGKNKTLGALVEFSNKNRQWISKEYVESICTDTIQWRKIYNLR